MPCAGAKLGQIVRGRVMADFSGLGALDAAAWPVLDELTASTGVNAASGIPTGGQAVVAMELDVGRHGARALVQRGGACCVRAE